MGIYRIELKTFNTLDNKSNRCPSNSELVRFLQEYITSGQGIVILHDSFYDYKYDTKLANYHKVDSRRVIGHMRDVESINGKIFIIVEFNDTFNPDKEYICYYRASLESNPRNDDRVLCITNLFAIDLITIAESEREAISNVSAVVYYPEYSGVSEL